MTRSAWIHTTLLVAAAMVTLLGVASNAANPVTSTNAFTGGDSPAKVESQQPSQSIHAGNPSAKGAPHQPPTSARVEGSTVKGVSQEAPSYTLSGESSAKVVDLQNQGAQIREPINTAGRDADEETKVEIAEINFIGSGIHEMNKTGRGSFSYDKESFRDAGDTTIGDVGYYWKLEKLNDPVCYTKGSTPTVAVKLNVTTNNNITLQLVGDAAQIGGYKTNTVTIQNVGTGTHIVQLPFSMPLSNSVFLGNITFKWKYGINAAPNIDIIETTHLFYSTFGTPSGKDVTAKRIQFVTSACNGAIALTKDDLPRKLSMAIGNAGINHFRSGVGLRNPWEVLDPGEKGPCVTFADLMMHSLQMVGVPQVKTSSTSVTSHPVAVKTWLGKDVKYHVLTWFMEWSGGPWVNEGVTGVWVDDATTGPPVAAGWIYYDVIGGSSYGPQKGASEGAQYTDRPTGEVENLWREPSPLHGPIMKDWLPMPRYSNDISDFETHYVRVTSPDGGESYKVGEKVTVKILSAGLKDRKLHVGFMDTDERNLHEIAAPIVATAVNEAEQFSMETDVTWDTKGVAEGDYRIYVVVDGSIEKWYVDTSDKAFHIHN